MSVPFAVSVVIPVRNGMPDVLDAVGSALAQTRPPLEVIVLDDGSSDGGADAVEARFDGGAGGPEVTVVRGSWGSAGAARNAGWRRARAPWVAFLDADDLWFGEKLAAAETLIARHPTAGWFFSDGAFRTLEGELRTSWFADWARVPEVYFGHPTEALLEVNFILTSSVLVRRELLVATGGFDEAMSHAEDLDLWIRLARRSPAVATARSLVRYQHRPGGLTRQVVARLEGNARLYERLARDPDLALGLRAKARRRAALSWLKLARTALRERDPALARRYLVHAWRGGRRPAALAAWGLSLLPAPLTGWARSLGWLRRRIAAPSLQVKRVTLVSETDRRTEGVTTGARLGGEAR
ncbi:MAG: glycosyltransferase family 2 protein [Candidatus Eisenbacteria bacterium]